MNDWVNDAGMLLYKNWLKPAVGKVSAYTSNSREKSIDEILMGYAIAESLLDETYFKIARQKDEPSSEDTNNLELAVKIAKQLLPSEHPLLLLFLSKASRYNSELESEVKELEAMLERKLKNKAI